MGHKKKQKKQRNDKAMVKMALITTLLNLMAALVELLNKLLDSMLNR